MRTNNRLKPLLGPLVMLVAVAPPECDHFPQKSTAVGPLNSPNESGRRVSESIQAEDGTTVTQRYHNMPRAFRERFESHDN